MRKRIKNPNTKAELVGKTIQNGTTYIRIASDKDVNKKTK